MEFKEIQLDFREKRLVIATSYPSYSRITCYYTPTDTNVLRENLDLSPTSPRTYIQIELEEFVRLLVAGLNALSESHKDIVAKIVFELVQQTGTNLLKDEKSHRKKS